MVQKALEIKVQAYDLMGKEELKNQAAGVLKRFIEASEKQKAPNS